MYESVDFFQFQKRFAAEPICLSNVGPMVLFVLGVITITVNSLKAGLVFNVRGAVIKPL